jgi:transketolase
VEQAATLGWDRYVGSAGHIIGMETFGASAPLKELQRKFGFTPENMIAVARELVGAAYSHGPCSDSPLRQQEGQGGKRCSSG